MSYGGLTSGGKDSILAIQKALDRGIPVSHLITVRPNDPYSYMFHSSNLDAVPAIAQVSGLQYHEIATHGRKEEELNDLEDGLRALPVEGIITGAIASQYQRERIELVAHRLALDVYAPLWGMDPLDLMREVAARLDAMIVVVAADGLTEEVLGARIDASLIDRLQRISDRYHIHLAGEGGEYETLTLRAPFYHRSVTYATAEIVSSLGRSELVLEGFT